MNNITENTARFDDLDVSATVNLAEGTAERDMGSETAETIDLSGVDEIFGSNDSDTIIGDGNNNLLLGLNGDDTIDGGGGIDSLDGGEGNDTESFATIGASIVADLASGTARYQPNGGATVIENSSNFENLSGSLQNDQLFGDDEANVLAGDEGNDILASRAGNDTLEGGAGNDTLEGGLGNDVLEGGPGNDLSNGGEGIDTADFEGIGADVNASLVTDNAQYVINGNNIEDQISNFENLTGSANNDVLTGDDGNNLLAGNTGNDTLEGGAGDDTLRGGGGNDVTDGGDGIDTADFEDIGADVDANLVTGTANYVVNGNNIQDQISNFENLTGSANNDVLTGDGNNNFILGSVGNDTINGGAGDDTLSGGGGNDVTDGGDGTDTADFEDIGADVDASLVTGTANYVANGNNIQDQISNIENLTGSANNDVLTGNGNNNLLLGLDGDDTIDGGGGIDSLDGGEGNDTESFATIGASIVADLASGTARYQPNGGATVIENSSNFENLSGSLQNDQLFGDDEANVLAGDEGSDFLAGRAGNDSLEGNVGNDTLQGGAGDDTLRGGGGNDLTDGGEGIDTADFEDIGADVNANLVTDTASYVANGNNIQDQLSNIENLSGSANNDVLTGDSGSNILQGGEGNDTIDGGGGVDTLDGGAGNDTESFATIGAPVVADLASNSASYQPNVEAGVTVFENFSNFENLEGTLENDQLFGNEEDNVLSGSEGNDLLVGRTGGDTLEGGLGNDVLRGGGGNDVTDGGEGIDTADYQDIGADVTANLVTGNANYVANGNNIQDQISNIENLTGSTNNDVLTGNDGNNLLAGNAGNDTLEGGAGDDVLRGDEIGSGTAIRVTVTNPQAEGGTFQTPVWFGFHNGETFDLYTEGEAVSTGFERLVEDGSIEGISGEFEAQVGDNGIDGTIVGDEGVPGNIDPGETTSFTLDVDTNLVGQGFFTWATMVLPSNDAFLAVPDDPLADPIFDENGNFIGPVVIERRGSDVLDAGTEVNTEEDAAFINQTAPNTGVDENGVVTPHPGFNGSVGNPNGEPVNILGGQTVAGATIDPVIGDFTLDDDLLLRIEIEEVSVASGGNDVIVGGAGDDTLSGGGGTDTFSFTAGTGADTITDFETDEALNVSGFFDSSEAALGAATQDGANTVIDLNDSDSITLENYAVDNLNTENFSVA